MSEKTNKFVPPASLEYDFGAPVVVPIRIGDKRYNLYPATAGQVIQYRNFIIRTTKVDAKSHSASTSGYADSEPFLLSLCLKEVRGNGELPVPVAVIRSWPNPVMNEIFNCCLGISGMLDKPDESTEETNGSVTEPPLTEQVPTDAGAGHQGMVKNS